MAYNELLKNFDNIRSYLQDFFVYGFKSRNEYTQKSARSYDNEKRRIESWLGDYIRFAQDSNKKQVFLSVDSRTISHNPLYRAFQSKSFTDNDIALHFYILDILSDKQFHTLQDIMIQIDTEYTPYTKLEKQVEPITIKYKLNEYAKLGVLEKKKIGKEIAYKIKHTDFSANPYDEVIDFFSETDPIGVIGSYIDHEETNLFTFKRNYILHAIDSEILYKIVQAIRSKKIIQIEYMNGKELKNIVPVRIYISTRTGRQHLMYLSNDRDRFLFTRIDKIKDIKETADNANWCKTEEKYLAEKDRYWGVSNNGLELQTVQIVFQIDPDELYVLKRLRKQKRTGTIEQISENQYRYSVTLYDPVEMVPWIRSFLGRIQSIECSDKEAEQYIKDSIKNICDLYAEDDQ